MIKKKIYIFVLILLCITLKVNAQLTSPYNLGFEEGYNNSPVFGWALGHTAKDSGYVAITTNTNVYKGDACAKISHPQKRKLDSTVASFYQRIDAALYIGKKIRFTATVKIADSDTGTTVVSAKEKSNIASVYNQPAYLFVNAKNKRGDNVARKNGNEILYKGWNKYSVDITIPETATEIRFGISFVDSIDIFLDDCSFQIISDDTLYYEAPKQLSNYELMYLVPFANLCGNIQYFHPSKNASEANWDQVMLAGMNQMKKINADENNNAKNINKVIKDSLSDFFAQLASQIVISNEPIDKKNINTENRPYLLAWQHTGVPTNVKASNITHSRIVNLYSALKVQDAVAVQPIPLKELQNKDLTITVKSKVNKFHKGALASISLRFENNEGNFLSFLKKDSIVSDKWQEYSISGRVPANATSGLIILAFRGYGEAFFDDVKVTYKDKKSIKSLTVNNPSFEQVLQFNNSNWMTTNETYSNGYMLDYSFNESVDGKQSLMLHTDSTAAPTFANETDNIYSNIINTALVNTDISGLRIDKLYTSFPLFVPANFFEQEVRNMDTVYKTVTYETYPISRKPNLVTDKNENFTLSWKDRTSRLIMLIKIYNLLKNFSLQEINQNDLDTAFIGALRNAAVCSNKLEFRNILQQFIDVSRDNRARVWFDDDDSYSYSLPFNIELIDNQRLFISQIDSANSQNILPGDEIVGISGKNLDEYFNGFLKTNALKWEKIKKILSFKLGHQGSKINLTIKKNDGSLIVKDIARNTKSSNMQFKASDYSKIINDSILYLDLTIYNDKDISGAFDTLSHYKNMILDLRGETLASEYFLSLIYDKLFRTSQFCVPYFTKPNKELMSYHKVYDYIYPAETKRFEGKFVFLIDWRTYGNGENFATVVKDYKLGTLIGEETQGALTAGVPIRLDADFNISLGTRYGYSPSGIAFLNSPVVPDIKVESDINNLNIDSILQEAINFLSK